MRGTLPHVAIVSIAILIGTAFGGAVDVRRAGLHALASIGEPGPCVACDYCLIEDYIVGHFTTENPLATRNGPAHPSKCEADPCETAHLATGDCGENLAVVPPVDVLWATIQQTNAANIQEAMAAFGDRVVYNSEREAIQLLGCNGTIQAHLPISREQAAVLQ